MHTAKPTTSSHAPSNSHHARKPLRRRLGRTWQDGSWRARLLSQLPAKTLSAPPIASWSQEALLSRDLPQPQDS